MKTISYQLKSFIGLTKNHHKKTSILKNLQILTDTTKKKENVTKISDKTTYRFLTFPHIATGTILSDFIAFAETVPNHWSNHFVEMSFCGWEAKN